METKKQALQYIQSLAEQKIISREELNAAFNSNLETKTNIIIENKLCIAEILYYIGGAIVFFGISILVSQNWSTLGFIIKITITLGSGIIAFLAGSLANRSKQAGSFGSSFFLIAALVIPMGLWVIIDHLGINADNDSSQSVISGIMLGIFSLSFLVSRKNIFVLFMVLFGTWFYFSFSSFLIVKDAHFDSTKFYEYRMLIAGIIYILLGYLFSKDEKRTLSGFLYGFGILAFLGASLALGGWKPQQNIFWELIYPVLICGTFYLSVQIKNKILLTWGTLFLMFYILKITSEYFSSGFGWPISLIIAGLAMIGAGYMSISLNKKYFSIDKT